MKLSVVGDKIRLRGTLRELVTRRLYFALGRFSPEIDQVTVRVGDANGPRGGADKRCRIVVKLRGLESVVSDVHGEEFESAVAAAADRCGRAVARALERRRDRRRKPGVSMAGEQDAGQNGGRAPSLPGTKTSDLS